MAATTTAATTATGTGTGRTRARTSARGRRSATVRARATASASAGVSAEDARELVAWLSYDKKVDTSALTFKEGKNGEARATLAAERGAGERVLAIPQDVTVTSVDVGEHPIVSGMAEGRPELVGLALWLCAERILSLIHI